MSDGRQVPPAPGTQPRVSKHQERPYREDAGIYSRHRSAGTHPYTQDEIEARIVAHAADAAAVDGTGPLEVPFLQELLAVFRHRLLRDIPLSPQQRLASLREMVAAEVDEERARRQRERLQRRRRELESIRRRTPPPVGGRKFTHPGWLLVCLIPSVAIELLGSISALEAAFDLDPALAAVFAASISAILVIAADQFGNALASITRDSRRWHVRITALLVGVAMLSGVVAIATLAHSRAANTKFQALGERQAEAGSGQLGAGAAAKPLSATEVAESLAKAGTARGGESAEPDIGFFVPLSVLILAAATLLAFRIEGAADWNEVNEATLNAERQAEDAEDDEAEALRRRNEQRAPQIEAEYQLAEYVEREHALLTIWLQRFSAEYRRFCALEGHEPRELVMPEVPNRGDVLNDLLHPTQQPPPPPAPVRETRRGQGDGSRGRDGGPTPHSEPAPAGPSSPPDAPRLTAGHQVAGSGTQAPPRPRRGRRVGRHGRPPGLG